MAPSGSQACTQLTTKELPPSLLINGEWQINKGSKAFSGFQRTGQPFVLRIVMLPLPPSVLILVLPITGLPEKAEVPRISGAFFGGAWIRLFIT